jgi:hypothetical protein
MANEEIYAKHIMGTEEQVAGVPIKEGQLLFTTDAPSFYLDVDDDTRIRKGGDSVIMSVEMPEGQIEGDTWLEILMDEE